MAEQSPGSGQYLQQLRQLAETLLEEARELLSEQGELDALAAEVERDEEALADKSRLTLTLEALAAEKQRVEQRLRTQPDVEALRTTCREMAARLTGRRDQASRLQAQVAAAERCHELAWRSAEQRIRIVDLQAWEETRREVGRLQAENRGLLDAWAAYKVLSGTLREREAAGRDSPCRLRRLAQDLDVPDQATKWLEMLQDPASGGPEALTMEVRFRLIHLARKLLDEDRTLDALRRTVLAREAALERHAEEMAELEQQYRAREAATAGLRDFDRWYNEFLPAWERLGESQGSLPEKPNWRGPETYRRIIEQLQPRDEALQWYRDQVELEDQEARQRQVVPPPGS